MSTPAELLTQRPDVWRAGRARATTPVVPSGHARLDELLPGGGWPLQALTELCTPRPGMGELSLLAPALARVAQQRELAVIAPPWPPCAAGWQAVGMALSRLIFVEAATNEQRLWAAEQALRSGACGAVMGWLPQADATSLRRLQLAAEAGRSWAIAFRPLQAVAQASPAALRLELGAGPRLFIHKCRGASFLPRAGIALDPAPLPALAEAADRDGSAAGSKHALPRPRLPAAGARRAG